MKITEKQLKFYSKLQKIAYEAHNLYKQKKYDELLAYNLADVRLTKKLYDRGRTTNN